MKKPLENLMQKYIFGLTATIKSDGLEEINSMLIGDVINQSEEYDNNLKKQLSVKFTNLKMDEQTFLLDEYDINDYYEKLINDTSRNNLIIDDVKSSLEKGDNILILTNRILHLEILEKLLKEVTDNLFVAHGRLKIKEKDAINDLIQSAKQGFIIPSNWSFYR